MPDDFNTDALSEIASTPEPLPPFSERIKAFAGDPNAQFILDAAASEDDDLDADQDGNQGDTDEGLDTPSDEEDQDADSDDVDADDSTDQETDREEGKGIKKKTFEERASEIAAKIVEQKLAELRQTEKAEQPDFQIIDEEKVEAFIAETEAKIDDLRLEGNYKEARKLSRQLDQLDKDLEENEQRKQAYLARQQANKQYVDHSETARRDLDKAAELYRTQLNIAPETWGKMGQWFETQISKDPLLVEEFNDIYDKRGKVAAIRFAHEYTVKNMGAKTKEANLQKEQSKNRTAKLTSSSTGSIKPVDIQKESKKLYATLTPDEAFMRVQELKRQARAA